MGPIYSLIETTTSQITPAGAPLPSPLLYFAYLLGRLHGLWCWKVQWVTVYANSGNFKKYMVGCFLNAVVGNSEMLRAAALVVLLTRRILDIGKQKVAVYRAWTDVVKAWNINYHEQVKVQLSRALSQAGFLELMVDSETYIWIKQKQGAVWLCLLQMGRQLRLLFAEILHLSVCYRLVVESASLNPNVRTAAVNELLLHTSEIFEDIKQNRKVIHTELMNNKALIQKIVDTIGIGIRAETLIDGVGNGLSVAESVYSSTSAVCTTIDEAIRPVYVAVEDTVRQGVWGAFRFMGFTSDALP